MQAIYLQHQLSSSADLVSRQQPLLEMVPPNFFYVQPNKRSTRYVPRSTSEGVAGAPRRFIVPPMSVPPMNVPPSTLQRYPDPPSKSMFFFDDQHRKWREQGLSLYFSIVPPQVNGRIPEAKIRQAAEHASMPQIGAQGGTAARTRTLAPMPLGPSGSAHPLTSPLSSRFTGSIPKPGMDNETPAPRHEQRESKSWSSN
jgi:hypothetical protein